MTKLAPEWVRTSDPVIRSPARYRRTTAPAPHPFRTPTTLCTTNNQYIHPRQQNVWISPAMGTQYVYFNCNARIYMYWWVGSVLPTWTGWSGMQGTSPQIDPWAITLESRHYITSIKYYLVLIQYNKRVNGKNKASKASPKPIDQIGPFWPPVLDGIQGQSSVLQYQLRTTQLPGSPPPFLRVASHGKQDGLNI